MAITKEVVNDRVEIVNAWNVQVRTAQIIKEDGVEISRTFQRKVLVPGTLDESDALVETDLSGEEASVQALCNAAWTNQVKSDFTAFLIENKR